MIHGLRGQQFERVIFQKLRLIFKSPDNCVVIDDDSVILIENDVENREGEVYFMGRKFMNSENLFNLNVLDSKTIGTQIVNTLSNNLEFWQLNSISFKAMEIPVIHDIPQSPKSFVNCFNFFKPPNPPRSHIRKPLARSHLAGRYTRGRVGSSSLI
jgi:hypothetical protein